MTLILLQLKDETYEMIDRFSIKIADQAIDDLKMRLQRTRWTDEIVNSGWKYGADLSYTKELINYWLNTLIGEIRRRKLIAIPITSPISTASRSISCTSGVKGKMRYRCSSHTVGPGRSLK